LGYHYSLPIYVFLFGPKNLPEPIARKLEDAFRKASQNPAYIDLAKKSMVYTEKNLFREELAKFLQAEKAKTGDFIRRAGLGKK
jgi:tripartite-type tricarboxylate transporter receptor subunit TctC